ncbi:MAG TPA: 3-oxoacyl-ACP synthase [Bacteroidetes bacterium]|nr:3-oxoacyl-ACP synthase [Bacteroidota bacterium]
MKNKKENWLEAAHQVLSDRIQVAEKAMKRAQEAAQGEEKSSAGDKYETARAMSQLERDMNARQLDQAIKERDLLSKLDIGPKDHVMRGAAIKTREAYYFIAMGLGKIEFDGEACIFLSPSSPLGLALMDKKTGEQISWNGQTIDIVEVF